MPMKRPPLKKSGVKGARSAKICDDLYKYFLTTGVHKEENKEGRRGLIFLCVSPCLLSALCD
jgi:hypothetical protein